MNTTELSTASPRTTFEDWLRRHPDALHWNPTDAMFSAWCGALASPAPGRAPLSECTTCGALVAGIAAPFNIEDARKRGIEYFAERYPALREALAASPDLQREGDSK